MLMYHGFVSMLLALIVAESCVLAGDITPTDGSNGWIMVPPDYTFSMLSWGPPDFTHEDATEGHKVVFIDVDQAMQTDEGAQFNELHSKKHILVCYFSAGTFEPFRQLAIDFFDEDESRKSIIGEKMGDWDEYWLDLSEYDVLSEYLRRQIDFLHQSGCTAVEPDNIDCYTHKECLRGGYSKEEFEQFQLRINKFMAEYAHSLGMAIAHKNNLSQIPELCSDYDFAIIESSFFFGESEMATPFLDNNKAVFLTEYAEGIEQYCDTSKEYGMHMKYAYKTWWENCFEAGVFPEDFERTDGSDSSNRSIEIPNQAGNNEGDANGDTSVPPDQGCIDQCGDNVDHCVYAEDKTISECTCLEDYSVNNDTGKCEQKNKKMSAKMIAIYTGAAVGGAAALTGLVIGTVFLIKKKGHSASAQNLSQDTLGSNNMEDIWDTNYKTDDPNISAAHMGQADL